MRVTVDKPTLTAVILKIFTPVRNELILELAACISPHQLTAHHYFPILRGDKAFASSLFF
jgi:hypothetical protein